MRRVLLCLALVSCKTSPPPAPTPPEKHVAPSTTATTSPPTPIRHVVVLVKENHTFDSYFTDFPGAASSRRAQSFTGEEFERPRAPDGDLPVDLPHEHSDGVNDWSGGKMNGFDRNITLLLHRKTPYVRYTEDQIPNYWRYAREFVLCDHFFASLMGPTSPGHFVTIAAQTPFFGNPKCHGKECEEMKGRGCTAPPGTMVPTYDADTCEETGDAPPCFDVPTVVDDLPRGVTWKAYGPGRGDDILSPFTLVKSKHGAREHFGSYGELMRDLARGDQANVIYINVYSAPDHGDEHPPAGPCEGENFSVEIIDAVMKGPHWKDSAIILTFDDFGGFYDHMPPPVEKCKNGKFFSPGFRLPTIILSPYAKKGHVLHEKTEQASIPRLIEELFGMPFLSARDRHARDGRAGSLLGAFDFDQPPRPPLILEKRACPKK